MTVRPPRSTARHNDPSRHPPNTAPSSVSCRALVSWRGSPSRVTRVAGPSFEYDRICPPPSATHTEPSRRAVKERTSFCSPVRSSVLSVSSPPSAATRITPLFGVPIHSLPDGSTARRRLASPIESWGSSCLPRFVTKCTRSPGAYSPSGFSDTASPPFERTHNRPAASSVTSHTFKLSLIHISEPTRLLSSSYAVLCLK